MVELIVKDFDDITPLEKELISYDIQYQLKLEVDKRGIKPPYLVVNGIPFTNKESLIWVRENGR